MARYTGPTVKISRRFGQPIFGNHKSLEKRGYPPGQHGPRLRRKQSEYSIGLGEKQKLRFMYGLMEKQFRRTFDRAKNQRGVTGTIFLQLLETRLDSIVYLLGFTKTRQAARQFVNHGHVRVNGKKVNISSYQVKEEDSIEIRDKSKQLALIDIALANKEREIPEYLQLDEKNKKVKFVRIPKFEEVPYPVVMEPNLVIEYYSR